jgi:hypothetical protein
MNISTKRQNYELYLRGSYGNKLMTWSSIDEFVKSKYSGSVSLRTNANIPGGFVKYDVTDINEALKDCNVNLDNIVINESAPDEYLTIQGELIRNEHGLYLYYSTIPGKMRDCMKHAISASGLTVKLMLEHYMTPSSYDDIIELLDMYPNHVIEFSTYSKCLGDCYGRNTIIWEVRNY